MKDLAGKVALITGGGSGIGQGIAISLAEYGADVVVAGRTLSKCETTAEMLRKIDVKSISLACDVTVSEDLQRVLDATIKEYGKLDILVNNAQDAGLGTLLETTDETFYNSWNSGPMATFRMMKMAYPHLKETKGHVINMCSSVMLRWDMSGYGPYAAVKNAIQHITRAGACEWGPDEIRVNALMPHAKSPALKGWIEARPEEAAAFQETIPLRRIGECKEDIGDFVALMCLPGSRYLTGQTIALDGGQCF